jgi:hypothetical protein
MVYGWHCLRIHYIQLLLSECLDDHIKSKLKAKMTYHLNKLEP